MFTPIASSPASQLSKLGIRHTGIIHFQSPTHQLIRDCLRRREGQCSDTGVLVIRTGSFTGRSPKDRYIVRDSETDGVVNWNDFNQPLDETYFDMIRRKACSYLGLEGELWIRDCQACADPRYALNLRVISETPAVSLFAHNMFLAPDPGEADSFRPEWHILAAPGLQLDGPSCGVRQGNAVIISFARKMILVVGTAYTGEIKKAVFSLLNFILPHKHQVLSMHCSANLGRKGDTAIYFGLSGTGKTTLSTNPLRHLIGDDEHGWAGDRIFNIEGGCYAKCIRLREDSEPQIFQAIHGPALVENVPFLPGSRTLNFDDDSITENTRVSYPLEHIRGAVRPSIGPQPGHLFFLTCDASGVLPPISRLNPAQAMYHFLSGYTAKVAGTETGIKEPKSTFSACFGAPFLPLCPGTYAALLGKKLQEGPVQVWLVNTGWTAGPYREGHRIRLEFTRSMLEAALAGELDQAEYEEHPIFGLSMPKQCPGVPEDLLNPILTWADSEAYFDQAKNLARQFSRNFEPFAREVAAEIAAGGPHW
jgi:phosphoenolpyruvate carboxykinase (ATP)